MQAHNTALLQIVSTTLSANELSEHSGLDNHASQQPPAPHAYFCFETSTMCKSGEADEHIRLLSTLLRDKAAFFKERSHKGDDISLFWFPDKDKTTMDLFSPSSLNFLAAYNITLIFNPQN